MAAQSEITECWVVSDGRAGIENQALGLAEAVARLIPLKITPKRIVVKSPWRSLPRALWGDPFRRLSTEGALLRPPYPRLWIGCGRLSIPYALAAHEIDPGVFTVQIQSPRAPARRFGLVIPPTHDRLEGSNVLPIIGSPNRVTASLIARDAEVLSKALAFGGRPTALMLIGGPNRAFRMNEAAIMRIARTGRALARGGYAVLATGSRRTPPETLATMRRALARFPHFIWDGAPVAGLANPYFGLLGLADVILVTEDSVNMAAEAALTGKPVHILALPRRRVLGAANKFDRFHAALAETGASRPYRGAPEEWRYAPVDETARAAAELVRRLEAFRSARRVMAAG